MATRLQQPLAIAEPDADGARRQRRWERRGTDDGAGARVQSERPLGSKRRSSSCVTSRKSKGSWARSCTRRRPPESDIHDRRCPEQRHRRRRSRWQRRYRRGVDSRGTLGPEDSSSQSSRAMCSDGAGATCPRTVCGSCRGRIDSLRSGDHTAYNQYGFAAVGFRESRENFTRQHDARDTFEGLSPSYLAQNARVNAAVASTLALAPPAPVVVTEEGSTDNQPRAVRL